MRLAGAGRGEQHTSSRLALEKNMKADRPFLGASLSFFAFLGFSAAGCGPTKERL